jgi:hypothetical protein
MYEHMRASACVKARMYVCTWYVRMNVGSRLFYMLVSDCMCMCVYVYVSAWDFAMTDLQWTFWRRLVNGGCSSRHKPAPSLLVLSFKVFEVGLKASCHALPMCFGVFEGAACVFFKGDGGGGHVSTTSLTACIQDYVTICVCPMHSHDLPLNTSKCNSVHYLALSHFTSQSFFLERKQQIPLPSPRCSPVMAPFKKPADFKKSTCNQAFACMSLLLTAQ